MKKLLTRFTILLLSVFSINSMAQSPGISYQAVILSNESQQLPGENVEDELLVSQELSFRFKIYNDNGDEYTEVHQSVFTDRYGMVNLVIGWGTPEFQTFDDISWDGNDKWLDVYVDFTATGNDFEILEMKKPLFHLPSPNSVNLDTFKLYMDSLSYHLANDFDTDPNNETQAISFSNDTLYLSNGGQVYLGDYLKTDKDEQELGFSPSDNHLSITGGNSVDLSSLQDGTGTDNQNLSGGFLENSLIYKLDIDNGNSAFINLSSLQGTDDQNLEGFLSTDNELVITIDDGNQIEVDLSSLKDGTGTDNQNLSLTTDSLKINGGSGVSLVDLLGAGSTDNQDLTNAELNGTDLKIEIEDGDSVSVDVIGLASDSAFVSTIAADSIFSSTLAHDSTFINQLTLDSLFISSIPSVDSVYIGGDSLIVHSNVGDTTYIDLSTVGTDNQDLTNAELNGTDLKIEIEDGDSVSVDVIGLASDSTFVSTIAKDSVFSSTLAHDSTFINQLTSDSLFISTLPSGVDSIFLIGDSLFLITDGGMDSSIVDLTNAGTDNQNISGSSFNGVTLTVGIEGGNSEEIDLSSLATGLDTIYSNGDTLYTVYNNYADTARVDLSATHTDDQDLTNAELNGTDLKIEIENGDSVSVDVIGLASDSAFVSTIATDSIFSSTLAHDSAFVSQLTSDSLFISTLPSGVDSFFLVGDSIVLLTNGGMDSSIVDLTNAGTDDQDLTNAELNGTDLKIEIENGDSVSVDVIGLASDSAFVSTIATDSVFSSTLAHDSLFINELTSDSLFIMSLPAGVDSIYVSGDSLVVVTNNNMDTTFVNLGGGGASDGDAWGVNGEDLTSDIGRTGKVGIGTTTPQEQLHVNGQVRIDSIQNGSLDNDSVLVVDANGAIKKIAPLNRNFYGPITNISQSAYTLLDSDVFIVSNHSQLTIITLTDPALTPGKTITVCEVSGNQNVQFYKHDGSSGGVSGATQTVSPGTCYEIISTGTTWMFKNGY